MRVPELRVPSAAHVEGAGAATGGAETGADNGDGNSRARVPDFLRHAANWAWRVIVVAATVWIAVWLIVRLRLVVIPLVVALLLAALLAPVVDFLDRKLPRLLATWLTILAAAGLIAALVVGLSGPIASAVDDFANQWDQIVDDTRQWLQTGPVGLDEQQVDDLYRDVRDSADSLVSGIADRPASAARLVAEVVGAALLTFVLMFFFLKDGPGMWAWALDRVRADRRTPIDRAGRASFASLQGWLRGSAITGLVEAVMIGGALLLLGVPAALPLAVITFFAAFFPIVGATVAGLLAVAIALGANGVGTAVIVGAVVLVVQQVEGDILMPIVMRRQVALHPVVILVVLAAGGALGGILGALVAVPLTAAGVAAGSAIRSASTEADLGLSERPAAEEPASNGG